MLDHIAIPVTNLDRSKDFYARALEPLGIGLIMEVSAEDTGSEAAAGFGANGKPFFWMGGGRPKGEGVHVAFTADNRGIVDRFHAAALAAGGRDNGAPGLRLQYHPNYYGAFVLDPDGHNIEAVCHT